MSITLRTLGVLAVAGLLTACGTTPIERTATGAVIGGAVASQTGGDVGEGALIGGALGAVVPCVAGQAGYTTAGNCY